MWLFPGPPIDGLHGMNPVRSMFGDNTSTRAPVRAAARPASHPACPAPITITSYETIRSVISR